jgi:hypothetical protein
MKNHGKRKGDLKRTTPCNFCGGEHRRKSREQRECRQRYRRGKDPVKPLAIPKESNERQAGSPTTHYQTKPAQWAIAAKKMQKAGWPIGKIAKRLGVNVSDLRAVLNE